MNSRLTPKIVALTLAITLGSVAQDRLRLGLEREQ
jgi:hypothetical protein